MAKKKKISALQEIKGVSEEKRLNSKLIAQISKKKNEENITEIVQGILEGNIVALSKAITLIESNLPKHFAMGQEIIKSCLVHSGKSVRIGITGVPGVGKSTFIESLGKYYTAKGHKVAVLAIDPSSSLSKGSILGDKTRMEELSRDENAYIRPSPSGNNLGGVAR
jgi:LAO/AO transport system kinase